MAGKRPTGAVIVALQLVGCGSTQTASLDTIRNQYLEAQLDYQECINASGGEINNPCASKRVIAETAERAYRDAMSKGLQGNR
jgi:hypothetical protein